jgi:hypothetical protein
MEGGAEQPTERKEPDQEELQRVSHIEQGEEDGLGELVQRLLRRGWCGVDEAEATI